MANTLSVKYTADVAELQAKSAIARAEVSATTSELNKLARAAAQGGTGQVTPQLLQAAQAASQARTRMAEINTELGKVKPASDSVFGNLREGFRLTGQNLDHLSLQIRDFTGVFTKFGEVLAVGFGVEKIVGLADAFAQYGAQISHAMDQTGMTATQLSSLGLVAQENDVAFDQLTRSMTKFAEAISQAREGSIRQLEAFDVLGISTKELQAHGNDMGFMLERVATALNQYKDGANKSALETVLFGGRVQGLSTILKDIAENGMAGVEKHAKELGVAINDDAAHQAEEANKKFKDLGAAASALARVMGQELTPYLSGAADLLGKMAGAAGRASTEFPNLMHSINLGLAQAVPGFGPLLGYLDQISQKSKAAKEAAAAAGTSSSSPAAAAAPGGAKPEAPALPDFGAQVAKMRTDMAQIASTWDGFQSGMLAKQLAVARATKETLDSEIKGEKDKVPQYTEVEQTIARLSVQLRQASGTEAIAATRETSSGIAAAAKIGAVQRLEQERASWQQLIDLHKVSGLQLVEVQRQINQLTNQITNEQAAQTQQIAKADADTKIEIARIDIQAEKDALDTKLQLNQVNAQQKLAILKNLTNQEFELNLDELNREAELLRNQPVEYARVMDQIRVLKARNVADLAALDRQAALDAHKAAEDEVKGWKGAVSEITQSESTFLGDYLTGRKTLAQSVIGIVDDMALKEIQADVRAVTMRLLLGNTAEAQKKALEAGGFAYHALFSQAEVTSTAAAETQKTAAVAAGAEARTAVQTAAEVQSKATSAAIGGSQVMANAAKAASGAYAAVAGIPYVGPILAPIAAGVAFAAVAAYSSLASSAGGDLDVDRTRLNIVHPRETIMPAHVAGPMRDFFARGAGAGSGAAGLHVGGDLNVTMSAPGGPIHPDALVGAFMRAARNGSPAIRKAVNAYA